MIYKLSTFFAFCFLKLFCQFTVTGTKHIPKSGPFILASNHLSNLDPPVLAVACPRRICFLAKEELFSNPLMKLYYKAVGALSLKRQGTDIKALRTALEVLKTKPLLVFPQGTRREDFDNASSGVGFLAKKSEAAIIVARIYGTDIVLGKGKKFFSPGKIRVVFSKLGPIESTDTKETITGKVIAVIKSL
jgi:1-acyl-sn-glycerol-3-phosphate acyltransferase